MTSIQTTLNLFVGGIALAVLLIPYYFLVGFPEYTMNSIWLIAGATMATWFLRRSAKKQGVELKNERLPYVVAGLLCMLLIVLHLVGVQKGH